MAFKILKSDIDWYLLDEEMVGTSSNLPEGSFNRVPAQIYENTKINKDKLDTFQISLDNVSNPSFFDSLELLSNRELDSLYALRVSEDHNYIEFIDIVNGFPKIAKAILFGGIYPSIYSVSKKTCYDYSIISDSWNSCSDLPIEKDTHCSASREGLIVSFCGEVDENEGFTNNVCLYSPKDAAWVSVENSPSFFGRGYAAQLPQGFVVCAGRITPMPNVSQGNSVYFVTSFSYTWYVMGNQPSPLVETASIGTLGNYQYLFGGAYSAYPTDSRVLVGVQTAIRYISASDAWVGLTNLSEVRKAPALVLNGNYAYIISLGTLNKTCLKYEVYTETEIGLTDITYPRSTYKLSSFFYDGLIYCIGGSDYNQTDHPYNTTYNKNSDSWTIKNDLPVSPSLHNTFIY